MSGFGPAVFAWFNAKVDNLNESTKDAVKDLSREGAEITEHHVRTRGIKKPGRIDTGAMVDSVDWKIDKETTDSLQTSFGFIDDAPFYTVFQERGTDSIAPMWALTDAADEIESKLRKVIGDAVKRS